MVGADGGDEQIAHAEAIAASRGLRDPALDAGPGGILRENRRQRRERAQQGSAIVLRCSREELDADLVDPDLGT